MPLPSVVNIETKRFPTSQEITYMPISVVINTYNAEQYLKEVLDSVKEFDEIVICDMESTDSTLDIAKEYNCRIVTFPKGNITIVEPARNFAIRSAINEWVLVVDADEVVTPQLKEYLYKKIKEHDCPKGIFISRLNKYIGEFTKCWSNDWQLRFVARDKTDWPSTIHAVPRIDGKVEYAPKEFKLHHLIDQTIRQRVSKINDYTDNEVARKSKKRYGVFALVYRPLWRFIRLYFMEGYFMAGKRGFLKACMAAVYQSIVVAKIIEKRLREEN